MPPIVWLPVLPVYGAVSSVKDVNKPERGICGHLVTLGARMSERANERLLVYHSSRRPTRPFGPGLTTDLRFPRVRAVPGPTLLRDLHESTFGLDNDLRLELLFVDGGTRVVPAYT